MTKSELLKKGAESGKAAAKLADQMAKSQQAMEAANQIQDPAEKAKKIKEIEAGLRANQADAVRAIGGQFLKGDDKKRFDTTLETSKLLRERIINHPGDFFPSWEDLTRDPTDQGRTSLQMLQSGFGDLSAIAKAAGYEKEYNAINAGLQIADLLDRYGLGDGAFSDIFGTKKQLDDLAKQLEKGNISSLGLGQAGIGLANLQAGLGMLSALGGVFGFGKDIAKVQKAVSALQGLQKAFSGDIAGGIDGILALDGLLFDLPPEAKEALSKAKELVNGLKKMGPMKPLSPSGSGVYVEGKHIAAFGLSGTVHGIPLMPGPGSANVLAYSMPVWRTNSDKHVCTLPGPGPAPHMPPPGGMVPVGATKTFANDLHIARHDDSTLEANGGGMVKIIPLPEAMAIAIKRAKEEAERKRKAEEKKKTDKAAKSGKNGKSDSGNGTIAKPELDGNGPEPTTKGPEPDYVEPEGPKDIDSLTDSEKAEARRELERLGDPNISPAERERLAEEFRAKYGLSKPEESGPVIRDPNGAVIKESKPHPFYYKDEETGKWEYGIPNGPYTDMEGNRQKEHPWSDSHEARQADLERKVRDAKKAIEEAGEAHGDMQQRLQDLQQDLERHRNSRPNSSITRPPGRIPRPNRIPKK